jgi:L-lactate dehydrogenase complex protein LldF
VNYAIADTGTIVLVENEGNIRLTTSLPRIHVAVMGIEKVVPGLQDLGVFLQLLSRSASGQKMCSYVSLLTGARSSADEEGPDELHVVLVDNGRVEMLADEQLRESLYCIRCGACLNVCPVYRKIGGHAYGWVYPGPIGAVLTPQMIGLERATSLPFASSLCGACGDVCPVKIKLPDMLLHLRQRINENGHGKGIEHGQHLLERLSFRFWAIAMRTSRRYRYVARLGRLAQAIFALRVPQWSKTRDLPPLAPRSFRDQWRRRP